MGLPTNSFLMCARYQNFDFSKRIYEISFLILVLFIQTTDVIVLTIPLPPPSKISSILVRCQIWDLTGNFCNLRNYYYFTLMQRKKCTQYHFISNFLCCKFAHFKNVYEQRRYWCSINAIAPWHFILKSSQSR